MDLFLVRKEKNEPWGSGSEWMDISLRSRQPTAPPGGLRGSRPGSVPAPWLCRQTRGRDSERGSMSMAMGWCLDHESMHTICTPRLGSTARTALIVALRSQTTRFGIQCMATMSPGCGLWNGRDSGDLVAGVSISSANSQSLWFSGANRRSYSVHHRAHFPQLSF